jgi:hypothetical protein
VRDSHHLIAVLMHGKNDWVTDIRDLLNWGFNDFTWVSPKDILQHQFIPFPETYSNFAWDTPDRTITDGVRRYYPYTGYSISGPFMSFFDQNGGLNAFGYPRGIPALAANGQLSQKFDKATLTCNPQSGQCAAG